MLFFYSAHKEYWTWLSKNPDKHKHDWPGWDINGGQYNSNYNFCLACLYAKPDENDCDLCPLIFPTKKCNDENGLLINYMTAVSNEEKSKYALEIAELKIKEFVEWI